MFLDSYEWKDILINSIASSSIMFYTRWWNGVSSKCVLQPACFSFFSWFEAAYVNVPFTDLESAYYKHRLCAVYPLPWGLPNSCTGQGLCQTRYVSWTKQNMVNYGCLIMWVTVIPPLLRILMLATNGHAGSLSMVGWHGITTRRTGISSNCWPRHIHDYTRLHQLLCGFSTPDVFALIRNHVWHASS